MSRQFTERERASLLCGAISGALAWVRDQGTLMTREQREEAKELARFAKDIADETMSDLATVESLLSIGRELMAREKARQGVKSGV